MGWRRMASASNNLERFKVAFAFTPQLGTEWKTLGRTVAWRNW